MGELVERVNKNNLKGGGNIADNYKNNTMFFYEKYKTSSKDVLSIPLVKMYVGGFYFIQYADDSNWMKFSHIFVADFRKFENLIIMTAVNFNFIPLEIRISIFDRYLTKDDFDKDRLLTVDHNGMYHALLEYGYEYSLVEYNLSQIKSVHKIDGSLIPHFLYSGHPINKYDPNKLYDIWKKKLETREQRHQEMMQSIISDFYDISNEINENYNTLKKHIKRVQDSYRKYG